MLAVSEVNAVHDGLKEMISLGELNSCFDRMATEITADLAEKNPVMITVMNGGMLFGAELAKRLDFPMQLDYVHVSRYGGEKLPGKSVHWKKTVDMSIEGRVVLLVDDILDKGLTLQVIMENCRNSGAKEVYTAVMLDKQCDRDPNALANADYVGFEIENRFVVGFGLDYHGYLRNLSSICEVIEE